MMKPASIDQAGYQYVPGYLKEREADTLFDWFLNEVHWQTEDVVLYGKRHRVPRLVAWFGAVGQCYRYSGQDHRAEGWPEQLATLRDKVGLALGAAPDFLLLNRYRSGQDSMGWHTDDEVRGLLRGKVHGAADDIASLSLGATRRFLLRRPAQQKSQQIDLEHGSLLLMDPRIPHTLPRTRRPIGERVNASFRVLS